MNTNRPGGCTLAALHSQPSRRRVLAASALVALGTAALPVTALAQDARWPSRTVRIVVPFAPGGSADVAARFLAPRLQEKLGQPVIVENRPGAGGTLAVQQVAKTTPADGYTIVLAAAGALTISPHLNPSLGYDPVADLVPITGFARIPLVLVANAALPAQTVPELIALAKREPGRLSYATTGNGSAMHLGGETLKALSDTFIVHIPYRGSGPAVTAVMGGEVQLAVVDLTSVMGRAEAGSRVRMLATLGRERTSLAPQLPSLHESGVNGLDVSGWFGLFAPARTPGAVVERLNLEIATMLRSDEVRERFKGFGIEPMPTTSAGLAQHLRTELAGYATVVKRAGIKAD